ncbi:MAG: beta-lactamase family protein [Propionibacterium sp.]|nr:beta-lactamase family protein [Propionibacterium sp.]
MRNTTKTSASLTDPATKTTGGQERRGSFLLRFLALPVAAVMGAGTLMLHAPGVAMADPSAPGTSETPSPTVTGSASSAEKEQALSAAQNLVDGGFPAALAAVTKADGSTVGVAVGTGNLETGEAPPLDGEIRIGSSTKTFTAVVILQLVQEGKINLDEPVETYLPGLLRGEGIDGSKITIRQLLQHTSGLPEYTDQTGHEDPVANRDNYYSPRDLLDFALKKPADFAPGSQWKYSNTNYVMLSLLAERVTHRPLAEQITKRIIEPLGLAHTYYPGPGEEDIRGTHPHGYHRRSQGELEDITRKDPSEAGGAGAIISTPSELNKFFQAVLDGTLLNQDSIAEMKKTVDAGQPETGVDHYGLGIISTSLSCGGTAWGHAGSIPGYTTFNGVGPDGTAVTVTVTALTTAIADDPSSAIEKYQLGLQAVDSTLCNH